MSKKKQRRKATAAESNSHDGRLIDSPSPPLVPAPTFAELMTAISRFTKERAPNNAGEALAFIAYMRGLAELLGPPTAEEVVNMILRFVAERAPDHPDEAMQFGLAIAGFVEGMDPEKLAALRAFGKSLPTPPPDPAIN